MLCDSRVGHAGTADNTAIISMPQPCSRYGRQRHICGSAAAFAPPLHPFGGQPPRSLNALTHDLQLEYAARVADAQHYYSSAPSRLVQPTAIVPELEMQPRTQADLHRLHNLALEMQPQTQAGRHLLHGSVMTTALHPGPMQMALPSIVGD